ncbi:hypothetical protein D3C87_2058680 [compost metagenome]
MPAAPLLSEALTATLTLPLTLPAVGLTMATTGRVVSAGTSAVLLATFTCSVADVPALPAAS